MPDAKITALTAISTVDPAADVLPIVDVSDTSMAASGTTKKITSNQILGAGGTATLASATVTGAATAARLVVTGNTIPANGVYLPGTNSVGIATNSTLAATFDSSGNLGLGVTPSAWAAGQTALQVRTGAVWSGGVSTLSYSNNVFYDGSRKYISTAAATEYQQSGSQHLWFTAPSGTAGTAITFTQAMTLDASGNLLVGTTSAGGNRLNVQTASGDCTALIKSQAANVGITIDYVSNYGNFNFAKSGTAKWSLGILNDSASTPTFKLFNDAAVGVYVTYGGTSWTATSDERLKDIIEPIGNAVEKVASLRSVIGKFKNDQTNTRRSFLIAQDVQAVLPEAVDATNPDKLGVAYSEVIPLLVAAIKELTARVQTLETR